VINKEKAREFFRQHKLICFAFGFIILFLLAVPIRDREPSYQGKTATEWTSFGKWETQAELDAILAEKRTAFNTMGEGAVLYFAKELSAGQSVIEQTFEKLNRKLNGNNKNQRSAKERREKAVEALKLIGVNKLANLNPSTPYLLKQINHPSDQYRNDCLSVLTYCNSHESQVVPKMLSLLNSKNDTTSARAALVLANYPSSRETALDYFKNLLDHTNSITFLRASLTIKKEFPERKAEWLGPKHTLHLRNTNAAWRIRALDSLIMAYPEDSENMSYATNLLRDPEPGVRAAAINRFSSLADQQPQYLPMSASHFLDICIASIEDSSEIVRKRALNELMYTWKEKATNALPKLEQLYNSPTNFSSNLFNQAEIGKAIQHISPEKAKELGIGSPDGTLP
jgi:hypothetical protein